MAKKPHRRSRQSFKRQLQVHIGPGVPGGLDQLRYRVKTRAESSPWQQRLAIFARDPKNRIPYHDYQYLKTILTIVNSNSPGRLNRMSYQDFTNLISKYYWERIQKIRGPSRPSNPGVYQLKGKTLAHKLEPSTQFRREYHGHVSPELQMRARVKMSTALAQDHDPSVHIDTQSYYLMVKLRKESGELLPKEGNETVYDVTIPDTFDIRNKATGFKPSDTHILHFDQQKDTRKYWRGELSVLKQVKGEKFSDLVVKLQKEAWAKAKLIHTLRDKLLATAHQMSKLASQARSSRTLSPDSVKAAQEANRKEAKAQKWVENLLTLKNMKDVIPVDINMLKESWVWYLWLIASENAYGVHVAERKTMRTVDPSFDLSDPQGKKRKQGPITNAPIRPARTQSASYDGYMLRGLGITNVGEFQRKLLQFYRDPVVATGKVWVPVTTSIVSHGIDPSDMQKYLMLSKKQHRQAIRARNIAGLEGGLFKIRKTVNFNIYPFNLSSSPYPFALVPAKDYLQWFDSPVHPGKRLIHGRDELVQGPKTSRSPSEIKRDVMNKTDDWDPKVMGMQAIHADNERQQEIAAKEILLAINTLEKKNTEFERKRLERKRQYLAFKSRDTGIPLDITAPGGPGDQIFQSRFNVEKARRLKKLRNLRKEDISSGIIERVMSIGGQ